MRNRLPELYVIVNADIDENVTEYPMGGGNSTKAHVKAFTNYDSAKRSAAMNKASIMKVTKGKLIP